MAKVIPATGRGAHLRPAQPPPLGLDGRFRSLIAASSRIQPRRADPAPST